MRCQRKGPKPPLDPGQAQLFIDKKLKPVWFVPADLEKHKTSDKVVRSTGKTAK